jgi:hypothetical protein
MITPLVPGDSAAVRKCLERVDKLAVRGEGAGDRPGRFRDEVTAAARDCELNRLIRLAGGSDAGHGCTGLTELGRDAGFDHDPTWLN